MFEQLKQRLDKLPTRAQRRAAVEAGLEPEAQPRETRPAEPDAAVPAAGAAEEPQPPTSPDEPQSRPTDPEE